MEGWIEVRAIARAIRSPDAEFPFMEREARHESMLVEFEGAARSLPEQRHGPGIGKCLTATPASKLPSEQFGAPLGDGVPEQCSSWVEHRRPASPRLWYPDGGGGLLSASWHLSTLAGGHVSVASDAPRPGRARAVGSLFLAAAVGLRTADMITSLIRARAAVRTRLSLLAAFRYIACKGWIHVGAVVRAVGPPEADLPLWHANGIW
jgi:hypothetical protein